MDALAVTPSDSYSLALWNAHVERTRAAAQTFKAGWPSPRVAGRDPYALRALVLIACIATFVAAGGERWKRVAAAFDWQAEPRSPSKPWKFNLGIFLPQRLGVLSIKVNTSPANYRGYNQMQLVKFDGTR